MNKKNLVQSIDCLFAALTLSWMLLVGGVGVQLMASESQDSAANIVQSEDIAIQVAASGISWQEGNFWSG